MSERRSAKRYAISSVLKIDRGGARGDKVTAADNATSDRSKCSGKNVAVCIYYTAEVGVIESLERK